MNGKMRDGMVVIEMGIDEAREAVKEFDSIPNTRDRQTSLKGTDIFPTKVPTLNEIMKWIGTLAGRK